MKERDCDFMFLRFGDGVGVQMEPSWGWLAKLCLQLLYVMQFAASALRIERRVMKRLPNDSPP